MAFLILGFVAGMFVGAIVGIMIMSLCIVQKGGENDD